MTVGKLRLKRNRHLLLLPTLFAFLALSTPAAVAQNSVDALIPTELMDQWVGCIDAIEADVGVEIILQEVSMRDVWTRIDTRIAAGVPPILAILSRAELERQIQPQEDDPRPPEELLEGMGILPLNDRLDPFDVREPYRVEEFVAGVVLENGWVAVFFDDNTVDVGLEIVRHACLQGGAERNVQVTVDLDVPTLDAVTAGSTLTGRFTITNTGNVLLRGLSLSDSVFGEVRLSTRLLNPGVSTYGQRPYVLKQADVATGSIRTVATVRAAAPYGLSLESEHRLLVNLSTSPALRVEIVPLVLAYSVGEALSYRYVIANAGNVTLESIVVSDDIDGDVEVAESTLAPKASTFVETAYVITQSDIDRGGVADSVVVSATAPDRSIVTAEDQFSVDFARSPAIEVVTEVTGEPFDEAGAIITYQHVITNTGNVTLDGVSAGDSISDEISLGETTLAPLESTTGQTTYAVTQRDLDVGSVANAVKVAGFSPDGATIDAQDETQVTVGQHPGMDVAVSIEDGARGVDDELVCYYTVKNTGNVTLSRVTARSEILGSIDLGSDILASLAETSGTARYVITQADVDRGSLVESVAAQAATPAGTLIASEDGTTVSLWQNPVLEVDGNVSPDTLHKAGEEIVYSYTLTNAGNVTLRDIAAGDLLEPAIELSATDELVPGKSCTGRVSHVVSQELFDRGRFVNSITAHAVAPNGLSREREVDLAVSFILAPKVSLGVEPRFDPNSLEVGDEITYVYTVRNTGNTTLRGITVADALFGEILFDSSALAPEASQTDGRTYTITREDTGAGAIENTSVISGAAANVVVFGEPAETRVEIPSRNGWGPLVAGLAAGAVAVLLGGGLCLQKVTRGRYERRAKTEEPPESCTAPGRYCFKKEIEFEPRLWKVNELSLKVVGADERIKSAEKRSLKAPAKRINAAIGAVRIKQSERARRDVERAVADLLKTGKPLAAGMTAPIELIVGAELEDGSCTVRFTPYICQRSKWVKKRAWEKEITLKKKEQAASVTVLQADDIDAGEDVSASLSRALDAFVRRVAALPLPTRSGPSEDTCAADGKHERQDT